MKKIIYISAISLTTLTHVQGQGSLTPPGAPGPTFKTLQQVEPRTPISTVPITISAPGSYYATTNLTGAASQNGITIAAHNVTVDLNGFALTGAAGSIDGIVVSGLRTNIAVRNGTISGWGSDGIQAGSAINAQFLNLQIANCGAVGLEAGNNANIQGCGARNCGGNGISTGSTCAVRDCSASENVGTGIFANNGTQVTGCSAVGNQTHGFDAWQRSTIQQCTAMQNWRAGFRVALLSSIQQCNANNNGMFGIISDNNGFATISDNNCSFNGSLAASGARTNGAGIFITNSGGCRIDANTVNFNYAGILVAPNNGALIIRNSATASAVGNYVLGAGNSWGPLVNVSGVGDISGTANANHPQANFSH